MLVVPSDQFNSEHIFKVPQGFVTGFIGRNGAGKTTRIRLIMDLYQPENGVIRSIRRGYGSQSDRVRIVLGLFTWNYFNERWTTKQLEKMIAPFYR